MDDAAEMIFETVEEWVGEWLYVTYSRLGDRSRVWCPEWFEHPEALARLSGLWMAWEDAVASSSPAALSSWWRDHADHHMPILTDPAGPFRGCSIENGHAEHRLGSRGVG